LEAAGLLRKYKGRFILSRKCRRLLVEGGMLKVYPILFNVFVGRFNWAYGDWYPELEFLQRSFLFTLFLLNRYGDEWRSHVFYEDCFLQAFPMVVNEIEPVSYDTPEQRIRDCYSWRVLKRFAEFLGLAVIEPEAGKSDCDSEFRIRKAPLLDKVVQFAVDVQD
jgi:hypothetical protein